MAKEYTWDISINGEDHVVCCVRSNNKYILYVDDEFVTNVYREPFRKMQFGLETEVEICGTKCLFVVWDEKPDLVVDGVMQGKNTDYLLARKMRKQNCCKGFRFLFWAGLFWICAVLYFLWQQPQVLDADEIVKFVCFGVLLMIGGARYEHKWKQW